MRVGSKTDRGRVRELNEDALGYHDHLFAVADGMGGHEAGEIASAIAVESILASDMDLEPKKALESAVLQANQAILDRIDLQPELAGMGTTLVVLTFREDQAYVAHVGDSRIYLLSQNSLQQKTQDHSLVAELVKNGGLTEAEAKSHPQRNILTRALGAKGELEIEINSFPVTNGDKVLLCTDGLTGMLQDIEIRELLSQTKDPQEIAENLVRAANEKGGNDNISVIIIEI